VPLPQKIDEQIKKAGLPKDGTVPYEPKLGKNRNGDAIIEKKAVQYGPKKGKVGYVDTQGRIWIKDRAHGMVPDHWDVQENEGATYFRVDQNGKII
jgi:hypothetical protein